ncbi:MAG: chemotaxis protein CheW [Deltaproteobacteria bacterium]|nr:chemotaxis protein CheW [Deltaproteobacteria bacterium]
MTDGDKLLMHIGDETFAVEADAVVAVVETERFFILPMFQSASSCKMPEFIKGVITRRGDIIVVIDIGNLFGMPPVQGKGPHKVAILKKDASSLGILAPAEGGGSAKKLSFLWKEELAGLEFKPINEDYIQGMIDPSGKKIRLVDWQKILEETQKVVSSKS